MQNLAPFLVYVFVTTFTPGPNNILAMSHGMRYGYRRSLGFLAGMFCGFTLIMLACGLLSFALLNLLPALKFWLYLSGAGYLVYLAIHTLFSRPESGEEGSQDAFNTFLAGFGLQFLNLKVILYGVSVYTMFISPAFHAPLQISAFAPLLAGVGFAAVSVWALAGTLLRQVWARHARWINLALAGLLLYTAVSSLMHMQ